MNCKVMRRKLITHGTIVFGSGEKGRKERKEWVTEPCGTPLFSDEERKSGTCRACASGWKCAHNYPVKP